MARVTSLLDHARRVGLAVIFEADELVVRGPRSAGPIAQKLIEHKSEVIAHLIRDRLVQDLGLEHYNVQITDRSRLGFRVIAVTTSPPRGKRWWPKGNSPPREAVYLTTRNRTMTGEVLGYWMVKPGQVSSLGGDYDYWFRRAERNRVAASILAARCRGDMDQAVAIRDRVFRTGTTRGKEGKKGRQSRRSPSRVDPYRQPPQLLSEGRA